MVRSMNRSCGRGGRATAAIPRNRQKKDERARRRESERAGGRNETKGREGKRQRACYAHRSARPLPPPLPPPPPPPQERRVQCRNAAALCFAWRVCACGENAAARASGKALKGRNGERAREREEERERERKKREGEERGREGERAGSRRRGIAARSPAPSRTQCGRAYRKAPLSRPLSSPSHALPLLGSLSSYPFLSLVLSLLLLLFFFFFLLLFPLPGRLLAFLSLSPSLEQTLS